MSNWNIDCRKAAILLFVHKLVEFALIFLTQATETSLRRTHHDVKAGILKSCASRSLSISQLLATQNLSYKILKPSLEHLASRGLVEYSFDNRRKLVRTTELGASAFRAYQSALDLLDGRLRHTRMNEPPKSSEQPVESWNTVIEQRDRTILPRPIILEQ